MYSEIIGDKNENNIEELLERARKDSFLNNIISGHKIPLDFEITRCARLLIEAIEKNMGLVDGLISSDVNGNSFNSIENLCLAIAYFGLGKKKRTLELTRSVLNNIDRFSGHGNTGLPRKSGHVIASETAAHAIINCLFLKTFVALNYVREIEQHIPYVDIDNGRLFEATNENRHEPYGTVTNSLLSIAYSCLNKKSEADKLINGIEQQIGFNKHGLINFTTRSDVSYTSANAIFATAYLVSGKKEKGIKLMKKLDEKIGCSKWDGLFANNEMKRYDDEPRSGRFTLPNVMLAIADMVKRYYES